MRGCARVLRVRPAPICHPWPALWRRFFSIMLMPTATDPSRGRRVRGFRVSGDRPVLIRTWYRNSTKKSPHRAAPTRVRNSDPSMDRHPPQVRGRCARVSQRSSPASRSRRDAPTACCWQELFLTGRLFDGMLRKIAALALSTV